MNKIVSTLLCGALALTSFSANAQSNWMKIQTQNGELVKQGDSVVVVAKDDPATKTAASLWSVDVVSRETSGNLVYKFTNKATNTTLKLKSNDLFAVGEVDAVRHNLDTLNVTENAEYKKLFTVEGGYTIAVKTAIPTVITPDTGAYTNNVIGVVLAEPGDMTHWMTVAELNQCAQYSVPLFAAMEGVDVESAAYEFVSTSADASSIDTIFTIQSKTSNKYLAVDSSNVTANSTVNVADPRQSAVFGFNVSFGAVSPFKNFGILFNPVNDSIAVAVMDSVLSWNVVDKKLAAENTVNETQAVAWIGNAQFINDKVDYITVDSLYNTTNGQPYWSPAPAQIEAGQPLADGLYILTSKKGIWGIPYETVCKAAGNAVDTLKNEYVPENQWMIKSTYEGGIYSYEAWNRFYGNEEEATPIKKVTTCDNEYFIFGTDTVSVKAIDANYGYKVFDGEELASSAFTLGLVNKLGAENVYMVMNEDSTINVLETETPLEFRAKYVGSKNFNLNDKGVKTFASDTLAVYQLYTVNAKGDTLWVGKSTEDNNKNWTLTTAEEDSDVRYFIFKAENEGEYKMTIAQTVECDGKDAIRVHENGGTTTWTKTTNNDVSLFTINEILDDAEYARLEAGHYLIIDNSKGTVESEDLSENEVLTKKENKEAKFLSLGDNLGSAAAIEENFSLWIDSAHVCDEAGERLYPTYYILKGATVEADSVSGDFLTVKGSYKANNDSVIFATGKAKINDTMAKVKAAKNTFLFKITDVENQYTIHPAINRQARLSLINGVVVMSTDMDALPVVVTKTSVVPTANEAISASAVTVIAGEGNVTINGAAGKKVVVSNILGQVVANTVLTSDNATIAAPAGVVVVAVEGETAVKAIVK